MKAREKKKEEMIRIGQRERVQGKGIVFNYE